MTDSLIGQETVDAFHRDGVTIVRGLFTPDEVEVVRRGIDRVRERPGPLFQVASTPDDPGSFWEDFCRWQEIDEIRQIAFESRAADVAQQLMGSGSVRLFHDHVLVKEPRTRQVTPWHQDQPYYNVDGQQNVSLWAPVDTVAPESTLEFLAASHRMGWLMPRTFLDNEAKWFPEGALSEIPDIEADRSAFDVRGWAMEPGDAVFFHMLTIHHAYGVPGPSRRRAFSLRFLGDDMVHAPRSWVTSPNFDGLDLQIPPGAPMEHPLFPVLR